VFTFAGSNDPGCYTPVLASRKVTIGGVSLPRGLNEVGRRGLLYDEQAGLMYNQAPHLQPTLGRFMQNDPLGYKASHSLGKCLNSSAIQPRDPADTTDSATRPHVQVETAEVPGE
jgi:RHS repeat-associated protein